MGGPGALEQWKRLEAAMAPLQRGAALFPAAALRADPGVALTLARFFGPQLALAGLVAPQLTGPFSNVVDKARARAAAAVGGLRRGRSAPGLPSKICQPSPQKPCLPTPPNPPQKSRAQVVTDPWLRRFIDLECFVLSGMARVARCLPA